MSVTLKTRESLIKHVFGKAGSISTNKATPGLDTDIKGGEWD
jgi:hypothetical protein